jgi:NADPH:quinone reductase-like Zn-dependent oxidoreductase
MNTIRALQLAAYGGPETIRTSSVDAPAPEAGQVLVRVHAAGVNGLDWKVREGYVRDVFPLQLPTTLGIELAGVVEAVGPGVMRLRQGDRVMGSLGRLGAYADLVAVDEANLSLVPQSLGFVEAAALPVASVAAWQSLNFAGPIHAGQRVLIHGAAGGLGGFAVQFAHQTGAEVFATALGDHAEYVRGLGADHVIAYDREQFEDRASDIDLVLDYVGGEVLSRSWSVLTDDGVIVSTASPAIESNTPAGRRGLWFVNTPDAARLHAIAEDVAEGRLQSKVAAIVRFDDLPAAIERNRSQPQTGKVVVDFSL